MKFWKNAALVSINILLVGSLLLAAFCVPDWFVKVKDQNSMEQVNVQKLEMDAYELSYHNFAEKLYTIACAEVQGIEKQLIQMPDNTAEVGDEELTEYVMQEMDSFLEKIWEMDIRLKPEELKGRELYMLYGTGAGESSNALAGIYLYKLTYVTEWMSYDHVEFEFFMDAEFHKLYRFSVSTLESNTAPMDSDSFLEKLQLAWENTVEVVLPMEALIDYWELEESYRVERLYGEEFTWKEKKNMQGKGSEDILFLRENDVGLSASAPLRIWRYLMQPYNVFHMQMGLWIDTYDSYINVSDSALKQ